MSTESSRPALLTPGQTVGPFYGQALPYQGDNELVPPARADAIRLHGDVLDGAGVPIPDALIEIWQADGAGEVPRVEGSLHRDGWTFTGWGRCSTDATGHYSFSTVLPGATEDGKAPFFAVAVFARGLLDRLLTRIYLPGHPANADDALLSSLPEEERATLIAEPDPQGLRFDIRLQGERETVFLTHG
ncbi:protocatechuate 3,4-dioxygenase subunit alpha [Nocardioides sp. BP30]|uniref:protocatechuate 3,4-dioxygenase subunit alpha n=1 Tax=Nocardioides sp. BP30 TaxID=3036374 RepID=UPI0024697C10|nr:protocatechuate 3,4-dioxygenase subunit alpha [Nocardioides sp. BP30]WGL52212.1 protocatechuate 3,4-dioxygenase subunit alpha [Nocardioides sp. BP30]